MKNQSMIVAAALVAAGCAGQMRGSQAPKVAMTFPGRDELARVPARPIDSAVFISNAVRIEQWDVDPASVPAPGAQLDATAKEVVQHIWGGKAEPSAALSCAARELARMEIEKGGTPGEGAQQYAVGRCGATLPSAQYSSFESKVPDKVSDAELWEQLSKQFKGKKPWKVPDGVVVESGVALVRKGERTLFAVVGGQRQAQLEAPQRVASGQNEVVLRGSVGGASEAVLGVVNLGTHGFANCRPEPVAPPKFSLRCPMAPADGSAWVNVINRPPRKMLAHLSARVMVTREGSRAPYAPIALPSKASGDFTSALVANLNAVRAQARMAPLAASAEQTAVNARLAGSILSGFQSSDDSADRLALGLMAGWEVPGMIRNGDLLAMIASSTADPATWLVEALEQPMARSSLLNRDARVIAVGAAPSPGLPGMGAVITTYALFEGSDDSPQVDRIFEQLNLARARRGLAPAQRLDTRPLDEAAARVFAGKQEADEALQDALNQISAQTQSTVHGVTIETVSFDGIEFPDDFLKPTPPTLSIAVTHHKVAGAAWGQYSVLMAIFPEGTQRQALAPAPRSVF